MPEGPVTAATRTPRPAAPALAAPAARSCRERPADVPHHRAPPPAVRPPHPARTGAPRSPVSHHARRRGARTGGRHAHPVPDPRRDFPARLAPRPRRHGNQPSANRPNENDPRSRHGDRHGDRRCDPTRRPQPSAQAPTQRRAHPRPAAIAASAPTSDRLRSCACTHRSMCSRSVPSGPTIATRSHRPPTGSQLMPEHTAHIRQSPGNSHTPRRGMSTRTKLHRSRPPCGPYVLRTYPHSFPAACGKRVAIALALAGEPFAARPALAASASPHRTQRWRLDRGPRTVAQLVVLAPRARSQRNDQPDGQRDDQPDPPRGAPAAQQLGGEQVDRAELGADTAATTWSASRPRTGRSSAQRPIMAAGTCAAAMTASASQRREPGACPSVPTSAAAFVVSGRLTSLSIRFDYVPAACAWPWRPRSARPAPAGPRRRRRR